jgi:hypothetical protein
MRKASPERPKAGRPVEGREDSRGKAASTQGKETKKNEKKEKKALRKGKAAKEDRERGGGEGTEGMTSNPEKQTAPDLLSNPEAKGRGLTTGDRVEEEPVTRSQTTSRGECSGQKMPDS